MLKNKSIFSLILSILLLCGGLNVTPVFALDINIGVTRLSGNNRYATSIAISKAGWTKANTVIIATGNDFPDALSGSALAKSNDAPILLTDKNALSSDTVAEIQRLKATKAILVGGKGVIGVGVENQLKGMSINITRLGGINRYETSTKVAENLGVSHGIIVATGSDFPDALSMAPIAGIKSMPILLSPRDSLDPYVSSFIKDKNIPFSYIVGGTGVLSSKIASSVPNSKRLGGTNRYVTNQIINTAFAISLDFDTVYLATGENFPDALSGSALAAKNNAPIMLTATNSISADTINYLKMKGVQNVVILGGTGAVSQNVNNIISNVKVKGIDITNKFTDTNFKNAVYELIGKSSSDTILYSDVRNIQTLNVSSKNIYSLDGIEYFDSLTTLHCYDNPLKDFDISNNTGLTFLNCYDDQLISLDVSNNTSLTELNCDRNKLTNIDVSNNTALTDLGCGDNQLTNLDVSKNTALTGLGCGGNQLANLDLSNNIALDYLYCGNNQLTNLDVSNNTALTGLGCGGNKLTNLDVSNNTDLTFLNCNYNQITNLDVSNNIALTTLNCIYNKLTNLDLSNNIALTKLDCVENQLINLNVSKNTALTYLQCVGNKLTNLDVSNMTALTYLQCGSNQLTNLDVSNDTALISLICSYNQIENIDVSNCTALTSLYCNDNLLANLDVSKNVNLERFSCNYNEITALYSIKNTWDTTNYRPQFTDLTHTKVTDSLSITMKH